MEVRPPEVRPPEVRLSEEHPLEVRPPEIRLPGGKRDRGPRSMSRRWKRYGLGKVGPEVRRLPRRKPSPPKGCSHPRCEHQWAEPVVPGHRVCATCLARIEARAAELRERQAKKDEAA
jgi:hypothetical protein